MAVRATRHLGGDMAEFGVFLGNTAKILILEKSVHQIVILFDSFQGVPETGHCKCSRENFDENMRHYGSHRFKVYEGVFSETVPTFQNPLAFAHIDCDNHDGTKLVLNHIKPLMVDGGLIIVDDYHPEFPGVMKAVDENSDGWNKVVIAGTPHNSVMLFKL
jgi:hypothetical protein